MSLRSTFFLVLFVAEKIKNHLKSAAQRENTHIRYGFALLQIKEKTKIFSKILAGCVRTVWLYLKIKIFLLIPRHFA